MPETDVSGEEKDEAEDNEAEDDEAEHDESEKDDRHRAGDYSSTDGEDSNGGHPGGHPSPCGDDPHRDDESFLESDVEYDISVEDEAYSPSQGECHC